jgi:hydroxymethylbilane synthase
VQSRLIEGGQHVRLQVIQTRGDLVQDRFDKMEGKGFFTREIEQSLLQGQIDLAVHSLKDLPTSQPAGLVLRAIPKREDPHDVLISRQPLLDWSQPWRIGTSSQRRIRCLASHFPRAQFLPLRGNVQTRLKKLADGVCDIAVLARAGLNRLDESLTGFHVIQPGVGVLVPAPGQGALALQVRAGDPLDLSALEDPLTRRCVEGERQLLARLEGGCQLPLGVWIAPCPTGFTLHLYLGRDNSELRFQTSGPSVDACVVQAWQRLNS